MKIKKIKNKHEEGFVLIVSLLVLAVSVAVGGGTVYNATKQVEQSKNWERSQQAFYAAEAGMDDAKKWLQDQYDGDHAFSSSGEKTKIDCYEYYTHRKTEIIVANNSKGEVKEKPIKDFVTNKTNKEKIESLENYFYSYYISEATVVSGKKGSATKGSLEDTGKHNQPNTSSKLKKFISAICGEGPNNQRVFLEVIFRADLTS